MGTDGHIGHRMLLSVTLCFGPLITNNTLKNDFFALFLVFFVTYIECFAHIHSRMTNIRVPVVRRPEAPPPGRRRATPDRPRHPHPVPRRLPRRRGVREPTARPSRDRTRPARWLEAGGVERPR